jgi:DNA-binding XRE family transcriptional regulator
MIENNKYDKSFKLCKSIFEVAIKIQRIFSSTSENLKIPAKTRKHIIFNYLIQTETKYIARNLRCNTNIHIYTLFTSLQYLQEFISHNIISNK